MPRRVIDSFALAMIELTMFHPQGPSFWELVAQALSATERGYDMLAPKFEYTPYRTPDAILAPSIECLRQSGPIEAALDLCCGTGAAMRQLRPLCRHVVGIDFSRGMLQVAHHAVLQAPDKASIELVRGNVLAMPFAAAFDVAVCFGALGHIRNREQSQLITAVSQVLKPGGRFGFVTSGMPSWRSARYWRSRGFNAAMHVRNLLLSPPFVMYYLTFTLPQVVDQLVAQGFSVAVHRDVFTGRYRDLAFLIATKL